jgi:hypothetical protein
MDVFISWSGTKSGAAAEVLRTWLPKIINAIKPWLSSADIDKGARWSADIASRLDSAKAGIICLTAANLHSDWILFETGALSKTIAEKTLVCPLLIDLEPTEVKGPLAQFQATRVVKVDVLKLLKTLNTALGEDALTEGHIDEAFEVWWPKLDLQLKGLPAENSEIHPRRTDRDVIEEILGFVRNQNRSAVPALAEEDKKQIFMARAWKAVRSVHGAAGGSTSGPGLRGTNLELHLTPSRGGEILGKYLFVVPADASPDEMEARILAQIGETDEANRNARADTIAKIAAKISPSE